MSRKHVPFLEPDLPAAAAIEADLHAIVASARISNGGPFDERLCDRVRDRIGAAHCIAVANATLGLMLVMRALAWPRNAGAELAAPDARPLALMPSFTFPATALAAQWAGLMPLFCDIEPAGWQPVADMRELAAQKPALLVACNTFGAPCDIARWKELAASLGVPLLVDSAAGLGASYADGTVMGGAGVTEVFSMHATKSFGVAEGGLVVTGDGDLAARLLTMRNFGLGGDGLCEDLGLNAKLSELHAALACRVLDGFDAALERRRALARRYRERLSQAHVHFQLHGECSPYQAFPVRLPADADRSAVRASLASAAIETRQYFSPPLHRQPAFAGCPRLGALPVTDLVSADILALPMSTRRTDEEIDIVCAALLDAL